MCDVCFDSGFVLVLCGTAIVPSFSDIASVVVWPDAHAYTPISTCFRLWMCLFNTDISKTERDEHEMKKKKKKKSTKWIKMACSTLVAPPSCVWYKNGISMCFENVWMKWWWQQTRTHKQPKKIRRKGARDDNTENMFSSTMPINDNISRKYEARLNRPHAMNGTSEWLNEKQSAHFRNF